MPGFAPGGLAPFTTQFTVDDRLKQAESAVRDFCRWHIAPVQSDQIDIDGSDYVTQVLPTRRLMSVSAVTLAGVELVEGVHYAVDPIGILRRIDGGRWSGRLALTMAHGYSEAPPSVQAIIADLAKTAGLMGASMIVAGPFTTTVSPDAGHGGVVALSAPQKAALSRYALEPGIA